MADLTFAGVSKTYPNGHVAVQSLDLEIDDGEFVVLVGPSGCGKTTALRMVAGLEAISDGEIRIGGRRVNEIEPGARDVAMVFQNYALYPHMTVFENIAFPMRSRRMPRSEVQQRVERVASKLGLEEMLQRQPKTLSGGQRQRVAMGRAIVREPQAFLMDEPLSNLDAKLRAQMRAEISTLQRELKTTTLYVTHDQVEAMTMGSRIAVLRKGVLQQEGTPQDLFSRPANLFVASFVGAPPMNLFKARLLVDAGMLYCEVGSQRLVIPATIADSHLQLADQVGQIIGVGVRPDHLSYAGNGKSANGSSSTLQGKLKLVETLGAEVLVHVELHAEPVLSDQVLEVASDTDAAIAETLERGASDHRVSIVARLSSDDEFTDPTLNLAVAAERLHFFDLQSGRALR